MLLMKKKKKKKKPDVSGLADALQVGWQSILRAPLRVCVRAYFGV